MEFAAKEVFLFAPGAKLVFPILAAPIAGLTGARELLH
jgi:hypothetical protein